MMALKRKRSSQTFSSPAITTTTTETTPASIPFFYQHSKPIEPLQQKPTWSWPTYDDSPRSSHHLNSRTRKRHRDDRPDEEAVYGVSCWLGAVMQMSVLADVCRCAAATMEKLFDAQRRHLDMLPDLLPDEPYQAEDQPMLEDEPITLPLPPQKSTLHSFWRIQSTSTVAHQVQPIVDVSTDTGQASRCETCEATIQHDDAMELDTGMCGPETACVVCRERVCDSCAVMRNGRFCGECARSR